MIIDCKCPHCGGDLVLSMRKTTAPTNEFDPFERAHRIMVEEAEKAGVTLEELRGKRKHKHLWQARRSAIKRVAEETGLSTVRMGRLFHRDHTSILNALRA